MIACTVSEYTKFTSLSKLFTISTQLPTLSQLITYRYVKLEDQMQDFLHVQLDVTSSTSAEDRMKILPYPTDFLPVAMISKVSSSVYGLLAYMN